LRRTSWVAIGERQQYDHRQSFHHALVEPGDDDWTTVELEHQFEVPVGIETAWTTLLDMEKVGPCFPGATADTLSRDEFIGSVKIKLGPVLMTYEGTAKIVDRDPLAHQAKIEASGITARSASTAAMLVTATLTALSPRRTAIDLLTTLSITGRPAKFDRSVIADVGNKVAGKFADALSQQLSGRTSGGAKLIHEINPDEVAAELAAAAEAADGAHGSAGTISGRTDPYRSLSAVRSLGSAAAEPTSIFQPAGSPWANRLAPVVFAGLAFAFLRRKARLRRAARTAADTTGTASG